MNYRNGLLDKLSRVDFFKKYYKILIHKILDYLIVYDWVHSSNLHQVFRRLYLERKRNMTVAMECHISMATLTRYIKKFEGIAEAFIHNDQEFRMMETSLKYIEA